MELYEVSAAACGDYEDQRVEAALRAQGKL